MSQAEFVWNKTILTFLPWFLMAVIEQCQSNKSARYQGLSASHISKPSAHFHVCAGGSESRSGCSKVKVMHLRKHRTDTDVRCEGMSD